MHVEPALTSARPVDHPTLSVVDPEATTGGDVATATLPVSTASERYVLGAEIGRGGMGAVYRATDTTFGREVAVKVLLNTSKPDSGTVRRFYDEALITGQLQHPGIPPAHELGLLPDGRPFLAMKLIKGDTLLKQQTDPTEDRGRLVAVFEGVCQAVAYAHAHGVIHRDLKPSNVMVGAFGEVQVMDWGLAKVLVDGQPAQTDDIATTPAVTAVGSTRDSEELLTQAGSVLGTPAYMPPEQAIGAVNEVDRRSDVFGLGGILAAVLTGRPPFIGDTAETTRVMAAKGKLQDCFARLEASAADPELVALCKWCLTLERDDRPADAAAVAVAVAALRNAAAERARQAELDKVKTEGEVATANARRAERRKRRGLWVGAAAALAVAVIGGLGAVLAVQRQANTDLATKNEALEAERVKVEQRFDMARKAIAAFHTTIDEQPELGNEAFRPLRKKLLGAAAGFYRELEGLLAEEPDPKSRAALADGYFQLAELTAKIGDKTEALAMYRKALVLRRELVAVPGADFEARLALSTTVLRLGGMQADTGDPVGALRASEEARDLALALETEASTDVARRALASSYFGIGVVFRDMGKPEEALVAHQKARDVRQKLLDAQPADPNCQSKLADSHNNIGNLLKQTGKPAAALVSHQTARDLRQKLADTHPTVTEYQSDLAQSHDNIAGLLNQPAEKLATREKARDLRQKLADTHPAVILFQSELADSHHNIGIVLDQTAQSAEALAAFEKGRDIYQKLANSYPTVTSYQSDLSSAYNSIGIVLDRTGRTADALAAFEKCRDLRQKLTDTHPAVIPFQNALIRSHDNIGKLLRQTGKLGEALAEYKKALDLRQKLADSNPTVVNYQKDLADSHSTIGDLLIRMGKPAESLTSYEHARNIHQRLADTHPTDASFKSLLAISHYNIARWYALASGKIADKKTEYADRAMELLAKAVMAGYQDAANMKKDTDLDPLRDREDFKKLLAELEKK